MLMAVLGAVAESTIVSAVGVVAGKDARAAQANVIGTVYAVTTITVGQTAVTSIAGLGAQFAEVEARVTG